MFKWIAAVALDLDTEKLHLFLPTLLPPLIQEATSDNAETGGKMVFLFFFTLENCACVHVHVCIDIGIKWLKYQHKILHNINVTDYLVTS